MLPDKELLGLHGPSPFTGSFLFCERLDYESRGANFQDRQAVDVHGISSLQESLDNCFGIKYLRTDINHKGMEDCQHWWRVLELPVLAVIQLKRFRYNPDSGRIEKVLDKFEFPEMLDLSKYCSGNNSNHGAMYRLFSVLVHYGMTVEKGFYHHYMDPKVNGDWHEFRDERVKKCTRKDAIDDNFGGIRGRTAYGLAYLRLDAAEDVTGRVELEDIPKHLYKTLKQQKLIP